MYVHFRALIFPHLSLIRRPFRGFRRGRVGEAALGRHLLPSEDAALHAEGSSFLRPSKLHRIHPRTALQNPSAGYILRFQMIFLFLSLLQGATAPLFSEAAYCKKRGGPQFNHGYRC